MATQPIPFPLGDRSGGLQASTDPVGRLAQLATELKELADTDWVTHLAAGAKEAVQVLEQIARSTAAIQAGVLAAAESSGKWALDGQRTFDTWVSTHTGTTRSTAGRAVKLSKSLDEDLPQTRKALADGSISSDHAQIIARRCTKTSKHRDRLSDPLHGENFLVDNAKRMDAGKFSKVAAAWAIETDPEGADRQWRQDVAKEEFNLLRTNEGYQISGWFTHVNGALLDEALVSHMGRKAADDLRPINQRRAGALAALAAQSLDSGLQMPRARIRPHLTVTMDYTTLDRLVQASGPLAPSSCGTGADAPHGDEASWAQQWSPGDDHTIAASLDYAVLQGVAPATLPDGTPIAHKALARLACDSMLGRVVFGPESTVLDAGREERIFPANQTRAIIARDRTCRYPGCDEGPGFGEIHHSLSWAKHNGTTHVDLGILLCYFHHGLVHNRDISITRRAGEWVFTSRDGRVIHPPGHRPPEATAAVETSDPPETSAAVGANAAVETSDPPDPSPPPAAQEPLWPQSFESPGPPPF